MADDESRPALSARNLTTELDQRQLGKTLWNIANTLRGAMNADDFRDYTLWAQCLSRV